MVDIPTMQETYVLGRRLAMLPALDALLGLASVTRAAESQRMTQPAMSRILARLRVEFDDPLLVRVGNRWELTPRGVALRQPVREILQETVALYEAPAFVPETSGRVFRVAIPDVVGAGLLPGLHEAFISSAPGCSLVVVPWPADGDGLDTIDVAIGTEPQFFPSFRMEPLFDDVDVLAYRRRDGAPLESEHLSRPHIAVVPAGFTQDLVDSWLQQHGASRRIAVIVPHYLQALHMVARTGLFAILPSRLVAALGPTVGVEGASLGIPQEADRNWLFIPQRLQSDPGVTWLRALIRSVVD